MPDCAYSIPPAIAESQKTLLAIATELRDLDQRLGVLTTLICPQPGRLLPDELRGVVQCVRTDLLKDAIETLEALGRKTEEDALRETIAIADTLQRLRQAG